MLKRLTIIFLTYWAMQFIYACSASDCPSKDPSGCGDYIAPITNFKITDFESKVVEVRNPYNSSWWVILKTPE